MNRFDSGFLFGMLTSNDDYDKAFGSILKYGLYALCFVFVGNLLIKLGVPDIWLANTVQYSFYPIALDFFHNWPTDHNRFLKGLAFSASSLGTLLVVTLVDMLRPLSRGGDKIHQAVGLVGLGVEYVIYKVGAFILGIAMLRSLYYFATSFIGWVM